METKYLDFSGEIITDESKAQIDFIKLGLLISKGEVFCEESYGYEHLNLNDDESIKNSTNRIISSMSQNEIKLTEIDRSNDGLINLSFNDNSSLEIGE